MTPDVLINMISLHSLGWIRESIDFPTPKSQSEIIVVPGRNSPIRFTEALGSVSFQPRAFNIVLSMLGTRKEFNKMAENIVNQFIGKLVQVTISEEPEYYYVGTLEMTPVYEPKMAKGTLTLSCSDGDAYRYHTDKTVVRFVRSQTATLDNDYMPVVPKIRTTDETTLSWTVGQDSFTKTLSEGTWEIPELQLFQGENTVKITSNGNTTFEYREGRL
ncbi:TPA: hypothetical protein KPF95_002560 [Clostridioides difficile]|jgi:hypothetical protein|uniref:hypothetical protein n=1 Tax=Clostridioides difficile TaxID=1496 RepID=UPI0010336E6C|nr:hypothetical protein [Clostridioides difficile]EJA5902353.1 hypothetical protein [Clostridioides difficile]MBY2766691.1 hypothetical protein [Clostridioides difficile]MDE3481709.1 hypothetical protein [Clostridioides difficile]MDE3496432.1 hypothetical protein [Clostridioides difficile]MDE3626005.1 hypothetical protein [Clostridioides difficile]